MADRTIRSPVDGVVDRTFVQVGEYVRPGQRLAIVHDPKHVWIEANIKETQIRKLAVGQPVEVRVDAYPEDVFSGRVRTIGSSTTGSFALLPNPNPSGNFTKITQRLPVRIEIDQTGERLAPGMMVEVHIDVRGLKDRVFRSGPPCPPINPPHLSGGGWSPGPAWWRRSRWCSPEPS